MRRSSAKRPRLGRLEVLPNQPMQRTTFGRSAATLSASGGRRYGTRSRASTVMPPPIQTATARPAAAATEERI